jgi:peptidoglycan/xylan/chitin deacetylase (PgdA/CDA1 family)
MLSSGTAALLYHNIGTVHAEECRGLTVLPKAFVRHVAVLAATGFRGISAAEWMDHIQGKRDASSRAVMITFDDAYAGLAEHAFPQLIEKGFTATVFVSTALIGGSLGCKPRDDALSLPILSASEIALWSSRGIEFGAHANRHVDLTALSIEDAEAEMQTSQRVLSEVTGKTVTSMAYPYGHSNESIEQLAAKYFSTAFTTEEGLNDRTTPRQALKRTMVQHHDTVADVCLRAAYGKSALERIRTVVSQTLGAPHKPDAM